MGESVCAFVNDVLLCVYGMGVGVASVWVHEDVRVSVLERVSLCVCLGGCM